MKESVITKEQLKRAPGVPPKPKRYWTVSDAADFLERSPRTVRDYILQGKPKAWKVEGRWLMIGEDVWRFGDELYHALPSS